jgi:membrane protease YdiL (CAAX protease family)
MNQQEQNNKKTVIKLILFILAFNLLGWLGWFVALDGTREASDLGILIWLVSPLLIMLILRLVFKDWSDTGIKPGIMKNGVWYAFGFFMFIIIIALSVFAGIIFGGITVINFNIILFLQAAAGAFIFSFFKNTFEEFAWRGFLTPKIISLKINTIAGHLLTGLIWGIWHIPYYLGLLDKATLADYTSSDPAVFIPMVILSMTAAGILFGELRLITGSVWPCVIMHTVSNVLLLTLFSGGFIKILSQTEIIFTPSWEGIITMILITAAGLVLYRIRNKKKPSV